VPTPGPARPAPAATRPGSPAPHPPHPPLPPGHLDPLADRHPPIAPAAFRKLDAVAVLTGPSLPVPLLCAEFRRTQGSVTGSCGVFMRYGRIQPLGSCGQPGRRGRAAPRTGSFRGPSCPRRPMIRSRTGRSRAPCGCRSAIAAGPLTCPSARRTGSYRGSGRKRGRRCRLRARDCMGLPGLQDRQFRR
jgi:hypothetical protein